ncbi:hypothetical protein EI427_17115 [Flammeovirga pectinis]|uniref:Histidine kinase/HSP90-like ATPase domain-containing protein n=1 Tax=Flammeovirga pectinis TaxID=2494373 RepID=A0A3S9P6Y6_9BACT|nr:ATP-binding protein [Flammeovirga pectinis]AZQ63884.1 hypothetical protein EI427_17115 [Flammeovirga pectinis]
MKISIQSENDIHYAQVECTDFAKTLGFEELDAMKISILVSELAQNIIKYATKGFIVYTKETRHHKSGILIEAIDKGPSIPNIEKALADNFSTGGTLGLGLPGIKRMSDILEIDSTPETGTHIKVIYWIK